MQHVSLLIIGAGPFGLALAAYAREAGLNYLVLGKPMAFWKLNMPRGMFLRSTWDWHLDPGNVDTIEAYLETIGKSVAEVEPLSLDFYLDYTRWFQERQQLNLQPELVKRLDDAGDSLVATLQSGETIAADNVVLALGFSHFKHIPPTLAQLLPEGRYGHTCDIVNLDVFARHRCLIIGGRQSAFEWTALLHENGAKEVHVCYRHETPQFTTADWAWFNSQVDNMVADPGWFRRLSDEEKSAVNRRFWEEGRLKLEPWLAPRIRHESQHLWPRAEMVACRERADGAMDIGLSSGETITVDDVIFATGYKVDMARVPLLTNGNLMERLALHDGYPRLDEQFQTNVRGLYITSMPAVQDFGLFFAFTISARASAQIIGAAVKSSLQPADARKLAGRPGG